MRQASQSVGTKCPKLPGERSHLADERPQTGIAVTQTSMMHLNRDFRHGNSGGDDLLPIEARVLRAQDGLGAVAGSGGKCCAWT
jgi:hypothetical protein